VRLSPLGTASATGLLYQPQMIDDGDCGAIVGIKIRRGNRSTRTKPAPAPLVYMYVCMYVGMCKGWAIKTGPCTATFNDLLCYTVA
jgi:hypothetical protein